MVDKFRCLLCAGAALVLGGMIEASTDYPVRFPYPAEGTLRDDVELPIFIAAPDHEESDQEFLDTADDQGAEQDQVVAPSSEDAVDHAMIISQLSNDEKAAYIKELFYEALYDVQDGDLELAIPKLELVLEEDPAYYGAWESLGWAYWKQGREEDAKLLWRRFRMVAPNHPLPLILLATVPIQAGDLQAARELYEQALEMEPDDSFAPRMYNIRFSYARLFMWSGIYLRAIDLLEELLAEDPNRTDVKQALGTSYLRIANYERALPLWQDLSAVASENPEIMAAHAQALLHTGHPQEAVELATRVVEIEPDNDDAVDVLISHALFSGTPEDALPYLRRLYRRAEDPFSKDKFRLELIRLYVRLYRRDPAEYSLREPIRLSRERLELYPESADSILLLAELLLMDDQREDAKDLFELVIDEFNPRNIRARRGLFEVFLAQRKYDEAREQYAYIRADNPHNIYL